MNYYTYILQSKKNDKYYIGSCKDIKIRLSQHNAGRVKSTKNNVPYELVYYEEFNTRQEAYQRERKIKSYKTGQAFKKLIC